MERRERKVAVLAGAGTGKTKHIIEEMVRALVDDGLEPTRLLALTFTVKAANELRDRLALALEEKKAAEPLQKIDRMEVGTIHSFASHVLRQFPLEAGVNPGFREDEGDAGEDLFRELWPLWLRDRIPPFLDRISLEELGLFARELSESGTPLDLRPDDSWPDRLRTAAAEAAGLLRRYDSVDQAGNRKCMKAARFMIEIFEGRGDRRRWPLLDTADRPQPKKTTGFAGWSDAEWERFLELKRLAYAALDTDDHRMRELLDWLRPFVSDFRSEYSRRGFVSLHGLLVHAARLLREHREIREHFKQRFQLIFVDEFQDTDPLQGELLLYISERAGDDARDWRDVRVEPGKLVIVGDPKQSIYLFRGADLDAYDAISRKLTGSRPEVVERLGTNYRSRREIVEFVNAVCRPVMTVPRYDSIEPSPERGSGGRIEAIVFEDRSADEAREAEAAAIADWILAERLRWGDVAILLYTLRDSHFYTDALRRRRIEYAIEGGKSFWQTPEIVDFVNLLTSVVHPTHETSVIGLLRSPLGAVTDRDLLRLREADAFCPLDADRVPGDLPHARALFATLTEFHLRSRRLRIADLVREVLERIPLREAWAATYRGEQAVANLEKLADGIAGTGARTLDAALDEARRRSRDREDEGESPLADDQLDAVRILTIHKSKGLEFPVVVLADLHRLHKDREAPPILRKWLDGGIGMRAGSLQDSARFSLEEARSRRLREESTRILYVALTRAKDRLLLTGGKPHRDNYLSLLLDVPGVVRIDPPPPQNPAPQREPREEPDPAVERAEWERRGSECARVERTEPIRRPSIAVAEPDRELRREREEEETDPRTLGTLCHDRLERIDLADPPEIDGEAGKILNPFFRSDAFREIAAAERVLREVPFVLQQNGETWSGQIDVLYLRNGRWIVGDYKTDREEDPSKYALQKEIYTTAVRQALRLRESPEFRLIYLRSCRSVPL